MPRKKYYEEHKKETIDYMIQYRKKYPERQRKWNRNYIQNLRMEIITLLGGKCSNPNCLVPNGCSDVRCLQIDHVKGGGLKERKEIGAGNSKYYKFVLTKIKAGSKDYQLLCANCNWIKRIEDIKSKRKL